MKTIFGKTQGLKANQIRRLEHLYRRHIGGSDVLSPELAKGLCEMASELGRITGVLIDRRGEVTHVMLGDASRLYLPDIGRARAGQSRLRGLRLILAKPQKATQTKKWSVDRDFVTDLEKLQLDLVAQIKAQDAMPDEVALAAIGHEEAHFRSIYDLDIDFGDFVADIESTISKERERAKKEAKTQGDRGTAVLVGVYTTPKRIWQPSINELQELSRTAGVQVVDVIVQQRKELDPRTIVGKGKLEELCLRALQLGAEVLIFDCDLSPSQLQHITDLTDLKVLDRTMLILDIFARRATSKGGRLQVELAQLQYSLPRLAEKQTGLSRLTGGIGGQGPGETKLEIDRRRVKDKIARMQRDIEQLRMQRQLRRERRHANEVPIISIVGYTNAGKSTLLNALTGADVYAKNELFATLDPTSRRLRFPSEKEVILTDTVGFIRDLPEGLINAFRATLEELHEADLLLHVVDGSDPEHERHIRVVNEILADLEITEPKRLLVLNKADLMKPKEAELKAKRLHGIAVSATTREGLKELVKRCEYELSHHEAEDEMVFFDGRV